MYRLETPVSTHSTVNARKLTSRLATELLFLVTALKSINEGGYYGAYVF
jgi:hypothetical protein